MPRWTESDLADYERKRAGSKAGSAGVCAAKPELATGVPLVCPSPRKTKGGDSPISCPKLRITFTVYSQRPLDWDNYRFKDLQDCLRHAGLIPDDDWRTLEGSVRSCKAHSKEEEKTVIEIITTPCSQH